MATFDDDISIISSTVDHNDDRDEADLLETYFAIPSRVQSLNDSHSMQVFQNAYAHLKSQFNNLFIKYEAQSKRIKELENQSALSSDNQTGSFLFINESNMENSNSKTEINVLNGQVKELQRKLMVVEIDKKMLHADKSRLEQTVKELQIINENKNSLECQTTIILQEKVKTLEESGKQLLELRTEINSVKEENFELMKQVHKCNQENAALKIKGIALSESKPHDNIVLNNGTTVAIGSANGMIVSKELLSDQLTDFSLGSSMPAADELEQLKLVIKKLKKIVQTQNGYLIKLDENPAIRRILGGGNRTLVQESLNRPFNSDVNRASGSYTNPNSRYVGDVPRFNSSVRSSKMEPIENALTIDNSWSKNANGGQQEQLQVTLTEHYDNVPQRSSGNLQKFQSKSEVISRSTNPQIDLQRRHSLTTQDATSPVFQKESARIDTRIPIYSNNNGISGSVSADRIPSVKSCPVCNADYTYQSVTDFQTHVFNCVDSEEQPTTLTHESGTERICPMCNHMFPVSCPQIEVDNHVNAHFGEVPADGFEILS